VLDFKHMKINL